MNESAQPDAPDENQAKDTAPPAVDANTAAPKEPANTPPGTPTSGSVPPGSPRDRFAQEVAAKRDSLDDHEEEELLWNGGYSPKAMVGSWILLTAVSIGLIVAAILVSQLTFGIAFAIIAVLWVLVAANYARMRLGYHYELTSQRFIHKTGLLTRRTDRIEVIDIDDVSYEQGPIQRVFGVGTINITSSDRSDPELQLLGIGNVSDVSGLIDDVRRAERRRRSLHIESI
ncbi:membrane protein YdbS, contains bPH2 (pleckstrin homology) domain [Neorhodopirellula lusitana]|uniref:Membrane protein YdbS, contains bPH2 (Pleckstrin homology) domain n=1 Tax=Neorhodopirellula lusitana TaxID=445327 RepID=A0ABY1QQW7_9BACT|nr:PH domain-containing protein [Neorhodopirellula lusitana]SMP76445.1 membrane protein YdbS, contains bPH2 (pleckstrin homology) domain [Neorhodopirellula lusitana]